MKLRQLIAYRNALQRYSVSDVRTDANMSLQRIMHEIDMARFDLPAEAVLEQNLDTINSAFGAFQRSLEQLKLQINQEIKTEEASAYAQSLTGYQEASLQISVEQLLNRRTHVSEQTNKIILDRVKYHSDWRYPGLIFSPGANDLLDHMVSLDPLYLVDTVPELLDAAVEKFNMQYQNRLCCYVVDENHSELLLSLPDDQVSVCAAVDFFNFRPMPVIIRYLGETIKKLRPGGTLCMTINDCDHVSAVLLAEKGFASYTPGSAVIDAAEDVGLELSYRYHCDGEPVTWLEFRRPGTLTSLRGGQTLAKIIPKQLARSQQIL